jgi:shikimate dehydrogenase
MTKRFAVIGAPVKHSLSPMLFNFLFAQEKMDATYVAHEVAPEALADCVAAVRAGAWDGLSVTVPHKLALLDLADHVDRLATRIGAANTLMLSNGYVYAHNTDAIGCVRALERNDAKLEGGHVVILGAGGAARAAVFGCLDGGAKSIRIVNRSADKAQALAQAAEDARCTAIDAAALQDALAQGDVLIQSTTVGMGAPDASPLPSNIVLPQRLTVMDMVYRPLQTALLARAAAQGCRTIDGLWMLVYQALKQFELWTGVRASKETALALHAHLRGSAT